MYTHTYVFSDKCYFKKPDTYATQWQEISMAWNFDDRKYSDSSAANTFICCAVDLWHKCFEKAWDEA